MPSGVYGSAVQIIRPAQKLGVEQETPHKPVVKRSSGGNRCPAKKKLGSPEPLQQNSREKNLLRFLERMFGSPGFNLRAKTAGILEILKRPTHKQKRIKGIHRSNQNPGKAGGNGLFDHRKSGGLQLTEKRRRKIVSLQTP